MSRTHDREHFYKFMTVETAIAVLETSSLRYSSPNRFNDPFDHQVYLAFPFTGDEFRDALTTEIKRIVYADTVQIDHPTTLGRASLLLRELSNRITPKELEKQLLIGIEETASRFDRHESDLNETLRESLNHSRVLCVTEELDNVVMWSHYADAHKGVALRLHCIDDIDNTLLVAKPVQYVEEFPTFPPITDYIRDLTGEKPLGFTKHVFSEAPYVKHQNWAYEQEWRVPVPLLTNEPIGSGYSDWNENPRVFSAIYFGCRIENEASQKLKKIVETRMPHMEIYQSHAMRDRFGMEYRKLR